MMKSSSSETRQEASATVQGGTGTRGIIGEEIRCGQILDLYFQGGNNRLSQRMHEGCERTGELKEEENGFRLEQLQIWIFHELGWKNS